ncbi:hypothetical protein [Klebsiella aerogenes]|uniref:hypothetical protein n=1 Tax=Klebsiella aerogenes TaxID=548 RepID=UPI0025A3BD3E|nr:hypothetical protein [Klebsiella aerogenes]MDM8054184.1 hypothetical protein [Klebsiella aerogenes]MDM8080136.1 hypothetical protein [Klebsiella aerogenes]
MNKIHRLTLIGIIINLAMFLLALNEVNSLSDYYGYDRTLRLIKDLVTIVLPLAIVVQVVSVFLLPKAPRVGIVFAYIGGIAMVPIGLLFLIGYIFSYERYCNANLDVYNPEAEVDISKPEDKNYKLTCDTSRFAPTGAIALCMGVIVLVMGVGIGYLLVAVGILNIWNGVRLKERVMIGLSGDKLIVKPKLYSDTFIVPLNEIVLTGKGVTNDAVSLKFLRTGRAFSVRKKMLAGENIDESLEYIISKIPTA